MHKSLFAMAALLATVSTPASAQDIAADWVAPDAPVEWMAHSYAAIGSQANAGPRGGMHIEESLGGRTYTGICFFTLTSQPTATATVALYDTSGARIWSATSIDISSTGEHCTDFSAGTWEAGTSGYQGPGGELALSFREVVIKMREYSFGASERVISGGGRTFGQDPGNPIQALRVITTAGLGASETLSYETGNTPFLPLLQ